MPTHKNKSAMRSGRKAPWDEPAPQSAHHTHLTPGKKATAKRLARNAGRPYPNLVDNMRVAAGKVSEIKAKSAAKSKARSKGKSKAKAKR